MFFIVYYNKFEICGAKEAKWKQAKSCLLFDVCCIFPKGLKPALQEVLESVAQEEEKEEEISGAQFLCETVIRSLTLEEAPDHRPLRRAQHGSHKLRGEVPQKLLESPFAAKILIMSRS